MPPTSRLRRIGSSDKYSKLRPHRGERLMFRPGPSRTLTPSPRASTPNASPIWRARSGFHVAASAEAVGKQVAFSESAMPRWSAYAVGAVAHDEGGDVCCGDGA